MHTSFLQELETRLPAPGQYLPSLRALATEFGVAVPTVRKALALLARDGRVFQRVPRGRFGVPSAPTVGSGLDGSVAPFMAASKEQAIAESLWEAWLAGESWAGPAFPRVRSLMRRFEAGHAVIRRALSRMERENKIRSGPEGTLRWMQTRLRPGRSEVHLVGDPDLVRSYSGPFFELLAALETELFRDDWGQLRFWLTRTPLKSRPPSAHRTAALIHPLHGPAKDWRAFLERTAGVPVAIVDLDARLRGEVPTRSGSMRLLVDHRRAGASVAEALRRLGHREAVFLSHLEPGSYPWLEERWKGFREGWGPGCVRFLGPPLPIASDKPIHSGRTGFGNPDPRSGLKSGEETGGSIPEPAARFLREGMHRLHQMEGQAGESARLFGKALELSASTAWVCVNDQLALLALGFLRDRGIPVPGRIAVVGFDNTREGFVAGLASYDFGLPALAHAAIAFFKYPAGHRNAAGRARVWKAPGSLRHRESLGPAHRD